jgi:hypothetical protein
VASALELSLSATLQVIQACKRYCDNSKHGHSSTNLDRTRKSREVKSTSAAHARVIAASAEPSALVRTMIFPLHAALAQGGHIRELSWNHSDHRNGRFFPDLNRGLPRRPRWGEYAVSRDGSIHRRCQIPTSRRKKNRTPRRQLQLIIISENFATLACIDSARMFQ